VAYSTRVLIFEHATRCAETGEPVFQADAPAAPFDEALWNCIFEEWREEFPDLADRVTLRFARAPGIHLVAAFEPQA
jgi:hypothetical protein